MQQERIWAYYQNQAIESFAGSRTRLSYLIRQVEKRRLRNVLNVGIGAGIFEQMALERDLQVSSLDPDPNAVDRLRKRLEVDARVGFIQQMPFEDALFDAAVVSEVLEHLDRDTMLRALQEINRVLLLGGYIVGTVPYQEDLAADTVVCPHCGQTFHRWGHLQSFSVRTMQEMLALFYEVEQVFPRVFPAFSTLNWKGKLLELPRLFLGGLGIHGQGSRLVFIARKASRQQGGKDDE